MPQDLSVEKNIQTDIIKKCRRYYDAFRITRLGGSAGLGMKEESELQSRNGLWRNSPPRELDEKCFCGSGKIWKRKALLGFKY